MTEIFPEKIQKIDFLGETRSGNFQKILENREHPPIVKKKFSEFFGIFEIIHTFVPQLINHIWKQIELYQSVR